MRSITIHKEWNEYTRDGRVPTPEELILLLQGKGKCAITHSEDHPEFAKLRNQLEDEGYIQTKRHWSNGDRVIKPFVLNGKLYKEKEQFSSGAAMAFSFKRKEDYNGV